MAEYLFIDKTIMNYNLISRIPDDLSDSIINDNIIVFDIKSLNLSEINQF